MKAKTLELMHICVRGVVQGVGFRPFVYGLATRHGLNGWVLNTSGDVRIEVEGEREALERFLRELEAEAPPLAHIEAISVEGAPPRGYARFEIRDSLAEEGRYQLVSPDIATCDACLAELLSPVDRRYRYPFTNCTNCGPRFTIIEDVPYDRPNTTMRRFVMCPDCQREYDDPLDRRFHAQPNACPACGPRLELVDGEGAPVCCDDVISAAAAALCQGKVLALKGLGGFHLACDAQSDEAVRRLRERKRRPYKPLAVMVSTMDEVRRHCLVTAEEERLLTSPQCPIVLMRWRAGSPVSAAVAPGLKYLGAMLPYTPLHHVLLREVGRPLVMTSGNVSEEPIAKDNAEALRRLGGIADLFVIHDRDIYARYDDSVALCEAGAPRLVRRARGYAPYPVRLPFTAGRQVLACGAELKNTFCAIKDDHAFVSQHIGDLENLETLEHFEGTVELYQRLFRLQPQVIACDLHPDYLSTRYARERVERDQGLELVAVQHHHAHVVSCMVENGLEGPVIGVAFDGTGYGTDGAVWGGEFLVADYGGFTRKGHLEYVPLPGGDAAVERPYRMALSYLYTLYGEDMPVLPFAGDVDRGERDIIKRQIERGLNCPLTSSCGRLFDGVSAMLGIRGRVDYEAQAAVELEMAADGADVAASYPFTIEEQDGDWVVRLRRLFDALIADMDSVPVSAISAKFHGTVAQVVVAGCRRIAAETGLNRVALSGGVFQNRLLLGLTVEALRGAGFEVYAHSLVPTNDGGISLGQAVIALFAPRPG
ncbi:MAG: carbamoyltransferase HypF, partial [Chloroflexota bacterium]|nr:carbamoyltransferase HypF [Chloroflexota bacterium]